MGDVAELSWDEIAERFDAARTWWVATAGPGGPHAVPVWGVLSAGRLCFYSDPTTIRSRNLETDPRVVLHLEDGEAPLIVHGRARTPVPASTLAGVNAAYRAKYSDPGDAEYLPDDPSMEDPPVHVVDAERALAWDLAAGFEGTQRRWRASAIPHP
jgi:hypothetical protein